MSVQHSSDPEERRWRMLGAADPYWAVCTEDRYRASQLSDASRVAFFDSGRREIDATFAVINRHIQPDFRPAHAVDFGCGVGRLTIPIARLSQRVTGVDISETMLAEARRNASTQGATNAEFELLGECLSSEDSELDFIHSYIVFQHIPPRDGLKITQSLVRRLKPGGVGALHYLYASRVSLSRRIAQRLRRRFLLVNAAMNVLQGKKTFEPMIPLHEYDEGRILELLAEQECSVLHVLPTNHAGLLGAMLYFRKQG